MQIGKREYQMGVISTKPNLEVCAELSASSFCRRRLAVVLVKMKFCARVQQAVTYIEQGHVRVGPYVVTEPAYHVTRGNEDYITWAEGSTIKRHVHTFNDNLDDFEFLGA
eukprot:GHVT01010609.1.p1 GENE.GHVT01010609.1~~GHVT01010609.1.p1  ORF type:complete len:110 (+),score=14.85 GHVT01010609.1:522-851(+)